jgi:hypothetical protein
MIVVSPQTQNHSLSALIALHMSPITSPPSTASHGRAQAIKAPSRCPSALPKPRNHFVAPKQPHQIGGEEEKRREGVGRRSQAHQSNSLPRRRCQSGERRAEWLRRLGCLAWHRTTSPLHQLAQHHQPFFPTTTVSSPAVPTRRHGHALATVAFFPLEGPRRYLFAITMPHARAHIYASCWLALLSRSGSGTPVPCHAPMPLLGPESTMATPCPSHHRLVDVGGDPLQATPG